MPLPELATVREVADALKVTPECVRKLCHMKRVRAARIGGRWRIDVASIDALLQRESERGVSDEAADREADEVMRRRGWLD